MSIEPALAYGPYDFSLPEQSLAESLRQIGQRAALNILFDADTIGQLRAPAIKGTMAVEEALEKVLAGTGFVVEEVSRNSLLVSRQKVTALGTANRNSGRVRLAATDTVAVDGPDRATESIALEEIRVTAQRREENSQSVPIAITAVSGEDAMLRGAVSMESLSATVPSLVTIGSNGTSVFIRGLGNTSASPNNEPSASTYVDGVYMPSIFGLHGFAFNNIERIEVLKGPQGTLFGRNSTAGVVQIITPDPQQAFRGNFSAGYGNFETKTGNLYLTGGLSDTLAADLSVTYEDQGTGWGHNLNTGEEIYRHRNAAARSKWLYAPSDSTTLNVALDYGKFWDSSGTQMTEGSFAIDRVTTFSGKFNAYGDVNTNHHTQYGASVKFDQDLGALHATSITAYRKVEGSLALDNDRTPARLSYVQAYNDSDYVSQEFQLSNREPGRVSWLGGVFLYGNTVRGTDPRMEMGTNVRPDQYREIFGRQKSRSYSAFGQATADLFTNARLTLGLRYTDETLEADGRFENRAGAIISGPFHDKIKFDPWTWRVALDYQLTPQMLTYVSYNRGFKSGGYNLNTPGSMPFYPETVDAYEVGLKSELLERRIRLNTAAFYYDYRNLQVAIVPGGAGQIFTNAAAARNYGFDGSMDFAATSRLTLSLGVSFLDAKYTDYPDAQGFTIGGVGFLIANAKGNDLPFAPPFSGNASASYRLPTSIGDFKGSASVSYSDKVYITASQGFYLPARALVSGSLEWWSQSDKPVGVRLWGRNLTDEYYFTNRVESTGGWYQVLAAPRTYGLTLLKEF